MQKQPYRLSYIYYIKYMQICKEIFLSFFIKNFPQHFFCGIPEKFTYTQLIFRCEYDIIKFKIASNRRI